MPNIRGGKGYKKGKGDNRNEVVFLEKLPGQMIGRIVKSLGDLNMNVFCEDNITRICKIAMGIKKKVAFSVGDIVLISLRDCLVSQAQLQEGKRSDRGDIIGKFHQDQYTALMKTENKYIFANMLVLSDIREKLSEGKVNEAEQLADSVENNDIFDYSKEEKEEFETKPLGWKSEREAIARKEPEQDVTLEEL
jgi:initiation factor 1A